MFWISKCVCLYSVAINPSRPNPGRREKIKLNFYFLTSVWYLKKGFMNAFINILRHHKEVWK